MIKDAEKIGKVRLIKLEVPVKFYSEIRNAVASARKTMQEYILEAVKEKIEQERNSGTTVYGVYRLARAAKLRGDSVEYEKLNARLLELQKKDPRYDKA